MNYFAVECGDNYGDHIVITNSDGKTVFENYLNMTYDEMKSQEDLDDFVCAVAEASMTEEDDQTVITLVGDDDVFIWGIIIGVVDDEIRYNLVDWKADGKMYRYAPS